MSTVLEFIFALLALICTSITIIRLVISFLEQNYSLTTEEYFMMAILSLLIVVCSNSVKKDKFNNEY